MEKQKERTQAFFDQVAEEYYSKHYGFSFGKKKYPSQYLRHNLILELLSKESAGTVLDVGCGAGIMSCELLRRGWKVTAIDVSHKMVENTRSLVSRELPDQVDNINVQQHDVENLPSESERFNAVILSGVIEYLETDEKVMQNVSRVLDNNGVLIVTCRNKLFNLYSCNEYTLKTVAAGEYSDLLLEFQDFIKHRGCSIRFLERYLRELSDRLPTLIQDMSSTDNKDEIQIPEDTFSWNYTMERRQHSPKQICMLLADYGFIPERTEFWHFHPFPPFLTAVYPDYFTEAGLSLEEMRETALAPLCCSGLMVLARKK